MRILISRMSSLGDVVCTLPVAVALKSTFPNSDITWIVDRRFAPVVEACSAVDRIEPARFTVLRSSWPVLRERYDVALDMQGLLKSALPVGLCKADRKLGYHWRREGAWLFSRAVLPDATSLHVVDQYVDVARAAGALADRAEFGLAAREADLKSVRERLAEANIDSFVVMNPGAGWATKKWPVESWITLVRALRDRGRRVILIGGNSSSETEAAEAIRSGAGGWPAVWVGKTSIGELIATLQLCEAHVGGDTGSTHIAAALGKPCVGLYSITNPVRSCPYGQLDRCLYEPSGLSCIQPRSVIEKLENALS